MTMLGKGGVIVVHDCIPPFRAVATPEPVDTYSGWCGQTWRAFVDVTDALPATADWFVVDSDVGVGVITVPRSTRRQRWSARLSGSKTPAPVSRVPEGEDAAWSWFVENREEALRLMSVEQWQARYA